MYYLYILQSELSSKFYIGSTADISARLQRHNAGLVSSTRSGRPWKLIYTESFPSRSLARKRETEIKYSELDDKAGVLGAAFLGSNV